MVWTHLGDGTRKRYQRPRSLYLASICKRTITVSNVAKRRRNKRKLVLGADSCWWRGAYLSANFARRSPVGANVGNLGLCLADLWLALNVAQFSQPVRNEFAGNKKAAHFRAALFECLACSLRDSVGPLSCLVLGRFDCKAHLLRDVPADETPDAVVLPVGRFGDLGQCPAFRWVSWRDERLVAGGAVPLRTRLG